MHPSRLLLTILIGVALQVCCCEALVVAQSVGRAIGGGGSVLDRACCHTGDDRSDPLDDPGQPDHECLCGVMKTATTDAGAEIHAPPVVVAMLIAVTSALPASPALSAALAKPVTIRDRSLLRQHCALTL